MMSAKPMPSNPFCRNSEPAASMMRSRFAAAFCRLTRIAHLSHAATWRRLTIYMMNDMNKASNYDDYHLNHWRAQGITEFMASTALAATLARRNIHYGWVVVAVTFLTLLITAGAMGTPGVLIVPLEREFGWDNAQISSALALRLMLFGLFGPFAAAFMNRFGVRRVIIFAMALIATGLLASMAMTQVWQLVLLWGVVVGIGTGLTAMVLAATVATRWFNHRRGLVMGMLAASSATGQLIFLPLIASLTTNFGWRMALVFVCGALGLTALVALFFMQDRPCDLDLPLYGETKI